MYRFCGTGVKLWGLSTELQPGPFDSFILKQDLLNSPTSLSQALACDPRASASQSVTITGMCHNAQHVPVFGTELLGMEFSTQDVMSALKNLNLGAFWTWGGGGLVPFTWPHV